MYIKTISDIFINIKQKGEVIYERIKERFY